MAAPFYMLVIVNERARFGAPLGYFTDRYMENIIRNNAVRCFIFQGTMLASGLGLFYITRGGNWVLLLTDPTMVIKWVALAILVSLLSHIHFSVQPRIESLMNQVKPDAPVPEGIAPQIKALRSRRKRLSGICLFLVLTALIMGVRATFFYNFYLALGLVAIAALYAWRVYRKPVPLGWM
ncbi:MAG: hypothetical protein Q8O05_07565 [Chloroflexota bacterium]|nr:hypothetical protein [Chloroflexota bacterium]